MPIYVLCCFEQQLNASLEDSFVTMDGVHQPMLYVMAELTAVTWKTNGRVVSFDPILFHSVAFVAFFAMLSRSNCMLQLQLPAGATSSIKAM
jgi:hypothetical protein